MRFGAYGHIIRLERVEPRHGYEGGPQQLWRVECESCRRVLAEADASPYDVARAHVPEWGAP